MFLSFVKIIFIIIFLLICVAYFTIFERKAIGSIQRRFGPNVFGYFGILQAFADGLKLFLKEIILPSSSNKKLFLFAPVFSFFLSLFSWSAIPFSLGYVYADLDLGILFIFSVSALSVYGVIIAGWSSNSKYAFLGALRSSAQILSYEVSIGFIVVSVILCSGSFNLSTIVQSQINIWYLFPIFPIFILFFISALAETSRHPFDLPEAEAELVSGYNVEYSAISFALFFLGESANMFLMSTLISLLFLGGWGFFSFFSSFILSVKVFIFVILFVWVRAAFPRYRYDQLMRLCWKVFLPFSISWVVFVSSVLLHCNWCLYQLYNLFLCQYISFLIS